MSNPKRTRKEIREAIKKIKIKRELKQYRYERYIRITDKMVSKILLHNIDSMVNINDE
jgi:hypothetical protein